MKFSIDADGEVQVSVEGTTGQDCEKMTGPFEEALGTVANREYKDTYYAVNAEQSQEGTSS